MQTNLLKPKAIQVEPLGGHRAKVSLDEQGKVVGLRRGSSQPDLRNFGKESIGQPIKVRLCAVDRGNRRISLELAS